MPPVRQASETTTTVVNKDQAHLQLTVEFGASSAGIWNANAVGSWRVSSRSQEKEDTEAKQRVAGLDSGRGLLSELCMKL